MAIPNDASKVMHSFHLRQPQSSVQCQLNEMTTKPHHWEKRIPQALLQNQELKFPAAYKDKAYVDKMCQRILDFLQDSEHTKTPPKFPYTYATVRFMSPSDFCNIFEYVFQQLDQDYEFSIKCVENKVPTLLHAFGYPYPLKQCTTSIIGATDAMPSLLTALDWLITIVERFCLGLQVSIDRHNSEKALEQTAFGKSSQLIGLDLTHLRRIQNARKFRYDEGNSSRPVQFCSKVHQGRNCKATNGLYKVVTDNGSNIVAAFKDVLKIHVDTMFLDEPSEKEEDEENEEDELYSMETEILLQIGRANIGILYTPGSRWQIQTLGIRNLGSTHFNGKNPCQSIFNQMGVVYPVLPKIFTCNTAFSPPVFKKADRASPDHPVDFTEELSIYKLLLSHPEPLDAEYEAIKAKRKSNQIAIQKIKADIKNERISELESKIEVLQNNIQSYKDYCKEVSVFAAQLDKDFVKILFKIKRNWTLKLTRKLGRLDADNARKEKLYGVESGTEDPLVLKRNTLKRQLVHSPDFATDLSSVNQLTHLIDKLKKELVQASKKCRHDHSTTDRLIADKKSHIEHIKAAIQQKELENKLEISIAQNMKLDMLQTHIAMEKNFKDGMERSLVEIANIYTQFQEIQKQSQELIQFEEKKQRLL
uniref:Kinetochore protein NDC80 n=1 Tax=Ditylenchus dipsaci TaxID=166011 RepID=A0A915EBV3_9BILA